MSRLTSIFLLGYYLIANLCLPQGDFSAIADIPAMYSHCKATEDKDMTPVDFITDHLINIDCIFDKHEDGDEQKPHTPIQFQHLQAQNYFSSQVSYVTVSKVSILKKDMPIYQENIYFSNFLSFVFRPPIV